MEGQPETYGPELRSFFWSLRTQQFASPTQQPLPTNDNFVFDFLSVFRFEIAVTMVGVGVDEKALTHLLEKVLVAGANVPVTLALEKAGMRMASDLISLQLDPYAPFKYDRAAEGGDKVEKNIPLLQAEMRKIIGIQEYIQYYSKNVSHKHFESLDDWEELTAKNFISFRINIAPFLPPDVTPPAVVTQPSPATSDPLHDWE